MDEYTDAQTIKLGHCAPDERPFFFLNGLDLEDPAFVGDLGSAMSAIVNTNRDSRGRVLGLLRHLKGVLFYGTDDQSNPIYLQTRTTEFYRRLGVSGPVMSMLVGFFVSWLGGLSESDITQQERSGNLNRLVCEIASIMKTIHEVATLLEGISKHPTLESIPLSAVGIDATAARNLEHARDLLATRKYPDDLMHMIQGTATEIRTYLRLELERERAPATLKRKNMNSDEDSAANTGTADPSLQVYIQGACGGIAPTKDLLKATFNRLAPGLSVGSINAGVLTERNKKKTQSPEGPCEVRAQWSYVPPSVKVQYEEATKSVVSEVFGPHVDVEDGIQIDFL
jgi:hypothetical protein